MQQATGEVLQRHRGVLTFVAETIFFVAHSFTAKSSPTRNAVYSSRRFQFVQQTHALLRIGCAGEIASLGSTDLKKLVAVGDSLPHCDVPPPDNGAAAKTQRAA
jgi:hypothetical protein